MLGDDGNYHTTEVKNFWTGTVLSPKLSDSKYERIMDIMDFSASDEGQDLTRLGFEWGGLQEGCKRRGHHPERQDRGRELHPSFRTSTFSAVPLQQPDGPSRRFCHADPSVAPERLQVINDMFASKDKLGIQKGTVQNYDWNYSFFTSSRKGEIRTGLCGRICTAGFDGRRSGDQLEKLVQPERDHSQHYLR